MRQLFLMVILLAVALSQVLAQGPEQDQCLRTSDKKRRDIQKSYPFNRAKEVKIVSFEMDDKEATVYEIPKINGQVNIAGLKEIKVLKRRAKSKLFDILININYIPLAPARVEYGSVEVIERDIRTTLCYCPRNAILFEDEKG